MKRTLLTLATRPLVTALITACIFTFPVSISLYSVTLTSVSLGYQHLSLLYTYCFFCLEHFFFQAFRGCFCSDPHEFVNLSLH